MFYKNLRFTGTKQYGSGVCRPVPEQVDERVKVGCTLFCDACHGNVHLLGRESQCQIDLPEMERRETTRRPARLTKTAPVSGLFVEEGG